MPAPFFHASGQAPAASGAYAPQKALSSGGERENILKKCLLFAKRYAIVYKQSQFAAMAELAYALA